MPPTVQVIQALGFFFIFAGLSFLMVRLFQLLIQGRGRQFRYGVETLIVLTVLYFSAIPGFEMFGYGDKVGGFQKIIAFLWWVDLAFVLDKSLRLYAWDGILAENGKRSVPKLLTGGVTLALYTTAIMIVMHFYFDKPIGALIASSGALALVLGFSAQSTLKEVFSGISLNLTHAIRMGDFVEIDGVYGEIFDINWRSVSVKNPHTDSLYVFPNSLVAEKTILNFSEPSGRFKYFIHFVAEVSAPPEKVIRAIAKELEYTRYVFRDPKPDFNIMGFTDSGIEIRIRFYFDGDDPWWDAQNEVCMAVWGAMRKHGFRLAIKRHELGSDAEWLTLVDDVQSRFTADNVAEAMRQYPAFTLLDEAQINSLAESATLVDLNPPSCFYHKGDDSNCCYLLLEGEVGIFDTHDGQELCIEVCTKGDVFGLTGMTRGTARIHMAQAQQYTVSACIDGEQLHAYLEDPPQLKDHLVTEVSSRIPHREEYMQQQLMEWEANVHKRKKIHLANELRKSIDHLLMQSWGQSIKGHFVSKTTHEPFLDAVMAGCALVITVRGAVDKSEVHFLKTMLHESSLLKHVDEAHALERFEYFVSTLQEDAKQGKKFVMATITKLKEDSHKAHLILAICHGLEAVHEEATGEEREAIQDIANALDIENDVESLTESMQLKRGIRKN